MGIKLPNKVEKRRIEDVTFFLAVKSMAAEVDQSEDAVLQAYLGGAELVTSVLRETQEDILKLVEKLFPDGVE